MKYMPAKFVSVLIIILLLISTGCNSTRSIHNYGGDATLTPELDRLASSVTHAAQDYVTIIPLGLAVLLKVTNTDHKIQSWAVQNTPVFGSVTTAKKYSDYLLQASSWIYLGSLVTAPGANNVPDWLVGKSKGLAAGVSAIWLSQVMTSELKTLSGRERPDGTDTRSFPSGHTSAVATNSALAQRNFEHFQFSPAMGIAVNSSLNLLTFSTGWARIEGEKHYPTDILFGAALGNFIALFINDAFLGRYSSQIHISSEINREQFLLHTSIQF